MRAAAVAASISILLLLGLPAIALADCPVDGDGRCIDMDPGSGPPGTVVHVMLMIACDTADKDARLSFSGAAFVPAGEYPSAALGLAPAEGEGGPNGVFVVPDLPPGEYNLAVSCPASMIEGWTVDRTFTITELPDTDAADRWAGFRGLLNILGLVGALLGAGAADRRLASRRATS